MNTLIVEDNERLQWTRIYSAPASARLDFDAVRERTRATPAPGIITGGL